MSWAHDLLLQCLVQYANSIAFPELVLPVTLQLKKLLKSTMKKRGFKRASCSPLVVGKFKNLLQAVCAGTSCIYPFLAAATICFSSISPVSYQF